MYLYTFYIDTSIRIAFVSFFLSFTFPFLCVRVHSISILLYDITRSTQTILTNILPFRFVSRRSIGALNSVKFEGTEKRSLERFLSVVKRTMDPLCCLSILRNVTKVKEKEPPPLLPPTFVHPVSFKKVSVPRGIR